MMLGRQFVVPLLLLVAGSSRAGDDGAGAMRLLFNGADLAGWSPVHGGSFSGSNRVIQVSGGKGWLRTDQAYTNFVLELEGRGLETNYNSGIFVRAPLEGIPWATNVWQVNFKQSAIGELLEGSKKMVPVTTPPRPVGEWIKFRIEARGTNLTLDVDGKRAWQFTEFQPAGGYVGLQAEGKRCEFRNLRIVALP